MLGGTGERIKWNEFREIPTYLKKHSTKFINKRVKQVSCLAYSLSFTGRSCGVLDVMSSD